MAIGFNPSLQPSVVAPRNDESLISELDVDDIVKEIEGFRSENKDGNFIEPDDFDSLATFMYSKGQNITVLIKTSTDDTVSAITRVTNRLGEEFYGASIQTFLNKRTGELKEPLTEDVFNEIFHPGIEGEGASNEVRCKGKVEGTWIPQTYTFENIPYHWIILKVRG